MIQELRIFDKERGKTRTARTLTVIWEAIRDLSRNRIGYEKLGLEIGSRWLTVRSRRRNCEEEIVCEIDKRRERGQKVKRAEKNHRVSFKRERRGCLDDGVFGFWLSISISCALLSFAVTNNLILLANYVKCPCLFYFISPFGFFNTSTCSSVPLPILPILFTRP